MKENNIKVHLFDTLKEAVETVIDIAQKDDASSAGERT